jgi:hypothetical protein
MVAHDTAERCEHADGNMAISILYSHLSNNHLCGRKNRMVQRDSLHVGVEPFDVSLVV